MMKGRKVNLATSFNFVTFCTSDLKKTPREAAEQNTGIKGVNFGLQEAGADPETYRNPNYAIDLSGEDRSLPTATVVIAPYKADCKELRDILLTRADYRALMYSYKRTDGARLGLGEGTTCEIPDAVFAARDAYAFECASQHLPVCVACMWVTLRASVLIPMFMQNVLDCCATSL